MSTNETSAADQNYRHRTSVHIKGLSLSGADGNTQSSRVIQISSNKKIAGRDYESVEIPMGVIGTLGDFLKKDGVVIKPTLSQKQLKYALSEYLQNVRVMSLSISCVDSNLGVPISFNIEGSKVDNIPGFTHDGKDHHLYMSASGDIEHQAKFVDRMGFINTDTTAPSKEALLNANIPRRPGAATGAQKKSFAKTSPELVDDFRTKVRDETFLSKSDHQFYQEMYKKALMHASQTSVDADKKITISNQGQDNERLEMKHAVFEKNFSLYSRKQGKSSAVYDFSNLAVSVKPVHPTNIPMKILKTKLANLQKIGASESKIQAVKDQIEDLETEPRSLFFKLNIVCRPADLTHVESAENDEKIKLQTEAGYDSYYNGTKFLSTSDDIPEGALNSNCVFLGNYHDDDHYGKHHGKHHDKDHDKDHGDHDGMSHRRMSGRHSKKMRDGYRSAEKEVDDFFSSKMFLQD